MAAEEILKQQRELLGLFVLHHVATVSDYGFVQIAKTGTPRASVVLAALERLHYRRFCRHGPHNGSRGAAPAGLGRLQPVRNRIDDLAARIIRGTDLKWCERVDFAMSAMSQRVGSRPGDVAVAVADALRYSPVSSRGTVRIASSRPPPKAYEP